jgi:hypothetical protein
MTKASRLLLVAFACVTFSATTFAGGLFGIIHVGKWQGAAYTTDKGAFSHCTAVAKFDNGVALILAQNANRSWVIGVTDPSWQFHDHTKVTLVLTFDGLRPPPSVIKLPSEFYPRRQSARSGNRISSL